MTFCSNSTRRNGVATTVVYKWENMTVVTTSIYKHPPVNERTFVRHISTLMCKLLISFYYIIVYFEDFFEIINI